MLESGKLKKPRFVHVVVSVRDRGTVEELRDETNRLAKSHGITGGICVFHPFRKDKYDGRYTLQDCVHFHIIGFAPGNIVQGGVDVDLDTAFEYMNGRMMDLPMIFMAHRGLNEWAEVTEEQKRDWFDRVVFKSIKRTRPFFKVVEDDDYKDFRGFRHGLGVRGCIQYLLTHCGVIEGTHAVTYWGSMSYRSLPAVGWAAGHYLKRDRKLDCFHIEWREARTGILDLFPRALDPDPKVHPKCPVCGSRDTEPCEVWDSTNWYDRQQIPVHPEPDWPVEDVGPDEVMWSVLTSALALKDIYGIKRKYFTRDELLDLFIDPEAVVGPDHLVICRDEQVLSWNLKSGRLVELDSGVVTFGPSEYNLHKALAEMWGIETIAREGLSVRPTTRGDDKLQAMLQKFERDHTEEGEPDWMSDESLVFGTPMERFARGCGWLPEETVSRLVSEV
jgi:hypothetical protein